MMASLVASSILLATYTVFHQALGVEARASVRWHDRAAAEVIADHLAEAFRHAVLIPDIPALQVERSGDGAPFSVAFATAQPIDTSSPNGAGSFELRRYTYSPAPPANGSRSESTLELRRISLAGARSVTPGTAIDLSTPIPWSTLAPTAIGQRITTLGLSFRAVGDPTGQWRLTWANTDSLPAVRIEVRYGQAAVVRIIAPRTGGPAVEVQQ